MPSPVDHDKIKHMKCKLRQKTKSRTGLALASKLASFLLLLIFALNLLPACNESSPPASEEPTITEGTSTGGEPSLPNLDNDVIEASFYVGLPDEREDRFSIAYAEIDDLSLNPFLNEESNDTFKPYNFIYETLLNYNKSNGIYESGIVESIDLRGRELVLHLYNDISFHNGFNLAANDIVQTFELYQSAGHVLGRLLDEAVQSYSMSDNYTVEITLVDEDAIVTLLDCLERVYILPYQLWGARLPANSDLSVLQELSPLPTIGSGPYRLVRQDNFVVILEKFSQLSENADASAFDDYPEYLIYHKYQIDELALAALAHSDLDLLLRPEATHPDESRENYLETFGNLPFWEAETSDSIYTLAAKEKRLGIAFNPLSQLEEIATRKYIQSILLRLDDAQESLYPNVPNIVALPAGNQLTLPSILPHTLTRTDYQLLPDTSPQVSNSYLEESSWERDPQTGIILDENGETVELVFYYPIISTELTSVCRQAASLLEENGLTVTAREVSVNEWQLRLQNQDYDLIYMESLPDENIAQLISRLQLWPGLEPDSDLADSSDYAAESGRQLLQQCRNDALNFASIIPRLQDLNIFLIENNLFLPLGIAYDTGAVGNDLYFSSDLSKKLEQY